MLTVCAMYFTGLTAWRLRGISQKINKVMNDKISSVVFLKNSEGSSDGDYRDIVFFRKLSNHGQHFLVLAGISSALASSSLCVNSGECWSDDCFWSNESSQGFSISRKTVLLNPFITFPNALSTIPFKFVSNDIELDGCSNIFYTLVETGLLPLVSSQEQPHAVSISVFLRQ